MGSMGSRSNYVTALLSRAWRETRTLFFQKSLKVFVRDAVLVLVVVGLMYVFQTRLVAAGLVPQSSNLAVNKALPIVFCVVAFGGVFAAYLFLELTLISPYRLWKDLEPPAPPPAAAAAVSVVADNETRRLAGVVMALRDRVLIWGFKKPVVFGDPYFGWLADIQNSTHPVWIDETPRNARKDFVQAAQVLPELNRDGGEREDIEHWRGLAKSSSDLLMDLLRGR